MTSQTPFELTDSLLERMLAEQAGQRVPAGLVQDIVAAVEVTPQRHAGVLPRIAWPVGSRRRPMWLLVTLVLLAALTIGVALVGSVLLRRLPPHAIGPLIVYQIRGDFAAVFTLDAASGEQTPLGNVQLTAKLGGQRIRWAADGTHAIVFGDTDLVQARVDLAARTVAPLDLRNADGQQDEVSPAGDRVARLVGDEERGMSLSVVDLEGTELVNVPLPAGSVASSAIAWAPGGTSVVLSGCLGCDPAARSSSVGGQQLLMVPLDGSPIRQLTDGTAGSVSHARFSPDGSTIAYSTVLCRDTCAGGIATVRVADGLVTPLTTTGPDVAPAWSPDGARIAFQRGGNDGGIYVIDRDGGNPVRLTTSPGSDGMDRDRAPVWSPEAGWIAFTRDLSDTSLGDLWVVPSGGGEASMLVENAAGDWGPPAARAAVLLSSPADTSAPPSAPAPASAPASDAPQASASTPASAEPTESAGPVGTSPLGGGFLLVWRLDGLNGTEAKTETVYTLDVGTGKETVIGTLPVNAETCCPGPVQWSADRRLAFLSQLRLQAVVDLETGALERVGKPPAGQFKEAISNRGDRIARVDEVSGRAPTIVVSRLTGKELQRIPVPALDVVDQLAWSPDDTALAVVGGTGDEPETMISRLLVAGLDGSAPRELFSNASEVAAQVPLEPAPKNGRIHSSLSYLGPAWSPDGRTIALATQACRWGSPPRDFTGGSLPRDCTGSLLSVDVASGARTVLVEGDLVPGPATWSPDGMRLAFGQTASDGSDPGIFVADRDGSRVTRLADGDEGVDWSPDGSWLSFTRYNWSLPDGTDHAQVWVVPTAGGPARLIAAPATAGW